jgi:hypothetical protein
MASISAEHHAIMWISTKAVTDDDETFIMEFIEEELSKNKVKIVFKGNCFGRIDLILEFTHTSAKVASFIVCDLQEKLDKKLSEKIEPNLICSSLTLCNKILIDSEEDVIGGPVRMYTFLRPTMENINFDKILKVMSELAKEDKEDKKTRMELYWTTSSYAYLLVTSGKVFKDMFNKLIRFRDALKPYFSESSTHVGLSWHEQDTEGAKNINALTMVKLKSGSGSIELIEDKEKKIWMVQYQRLGWSDLCLGIEKETLRAIKEAVLDLRKNHSEIINTCTLLLPEEIK